MRYQTSTRDTFETLARLLPCHNDLHTEEEIARVRSWLPKSVPNGHFLQPYRWALSCKLRRIRVKAGGPIPTYARHRALIEAAGENCPDCGSPMRRWINNRYPTIEHIIPVSRGGTNAPKNLRVICNVCNSSRGNRA